MGIIYFIFNKLNKKLSQNKVNENILPLNAVTTKETQYRPYNTNLLETDSLRFPSPENVLIFLHS